MSNWVDISPALKNLDELTRQLTGRQLAIGISRGINSTLLKGRTVARAAVKHEYNIPQKNLAGIGINKANTITLTGSIYASAKPIPMDAFDPRFETRTQSLRVSKKGVQRVKAGSKSKKRMATIGQGVSIEVHKGKRETVPYAFMIAGQKPRVFARGTYRIGTFGFVQRHTRLTNSTGSDSVKPLISTTVHAAVINKSTRGMILTRVREAYPADLKHELEYIISKLPKN